LKNLEFFIKGSAEAPYMVKIWVDDRGLNDVRCSCPAGKGKYFCKHIYALFAGDIENLVSENYDDAASLAHCLIKTSYMDAYKKYSSTDYYSSQFNNFKNMYSEEQQWNLSEATSIIDSLGKYYIVRRYERGVKKHYYDFFDSSLNYKCSLDKKILSKEELTKLKEIPLIKINGFYEYLQSELSMQNFTAPKKIADKSKKEMREILNNILSNRAK